MVSLPADDEKYIKRCLELAARAEGRTSPNPMVGCLVLDKAGKVVGEGFHPRAGESHAEVFALDRAGDAARGGTLYTNLEPCCHHGRTPPCSQRVIKSGVARVVIGTGDPNPKVDSGGIRELQAAGIEVRSGVLEEDCRYLNRGFLKVITSGMPWLALKMAVTMDGKIADREGGSRWITGAESRQYVMDLRNRFDAVMVGAGTGRADDPSLTVRMAEGVKPDLQPPVRDPLRVVVDPRLSLPAQAKIFAPGTGELKVIVFCAEDKKLLQGSRQNYPAHVEIIPVAGSGNFSDSNSGVGMFKLDLTACMKALKDRKLNTVLCEGGARLAGSVLEADIVDEVYWFVAPKILADSQALPAVSSGWARLIGQTPNLRVKEHKLFSQDIMIHALR